MTSLPSSCPSSAELKGITTQLADLAATLEERAGLSEDDIESADAFLTTVTDNWVGPRASHDLGQVRSYVKQIRGTPKAFRSVAKKLASFSEVADVIAAAVAKQEEAIDKAYGLPAALAGETDAMVANAYSELWSLSSEWEAQCSSFAGEINSAAEPLEGASAATATGFSAPVVTGSAFVVALVGLTSSGGVDLADVGYTNHRLRALIEGKAWVSMGTQPVIDMMSTLSAPAAAVYWTLLTKDEQAALIDARPELVAKVIHGGGGLTLEQLQSLDTSNRFAMFTDEVTDTWEFSANLRIFAVEIGGGHTAIVMQMSDGSVQMTLTDDFHAGAGVKAKHESGEAAAMLGFFTSSEQVFRFPDAPAAEAALQSLERPPQRYVGPGTGNEYYAVPYTWDYGTAVDDMWKQYGTVDRDEIGLYQKAATTFKDTVGEMGVETELQLSGFDTDVTELSDEASRTGVALSAEVSVDAGAGAVGAGASGSFLVEVYNQGGDIFASLTVAADAQGSLVADVLGENAPIHVSAEGAVEGDVTVTATVPVNGDLAWNAGRMAGQLSTGTPPEALLDMYDDATISVSVNSGTSFTTAEGVDAGLIAIETTHTEAHSSNAVTLHKAPGGEWYSQNNLNDLVDEELVNASLNYVP